MNLVAKGDRLNLTAKGIEAGGDGTKFYIGAGWDKPSVGKADVDLCGLHLKDGKVVNMAYYGEKKIPGFQLSEDNRSGEGDGDDEFLLIDTTQIPADVNGLIIALVSYEGPDLSKTPNPLFRVCTGYDKNAPETFRYPVADNAFDKDTVLIAARFQKTANGQWHFQAVGKFYAKGQGFGAITALSEIDFSQI